MAKKKELKTKLKTIKKPKKGKAPKRLNYAMKNVKPTSKMKLF